MSKDNPAKPIAEHSRVMTDGQRDKKTVKKSPGKAVEVPLADVVQKAYQSRNRPVTRPKKIRPKPKDGRFITNVEYENLLVLANDDVLLSVPARLLVTFGSDRVPGIRAEILGFVQAVFESHPMLSMHSKQGFFRNTPDGPDPVGVLRSIMNFPFADCEDERLRKTKKKDQRTLRINASNAVALWLMSNRSWDLSDVLRLLGVNVWGLEAAEHKKTEQQLNAVLGINNVVPLGLVVQTFERIADEQILAADIARQQAERLGSEIKSLRKHLEDASNTIASRDAKIKELTSDLGKERERHGDQRSILRDEKESLRSRVLNRLKDDVRLLDDGLHALRRDPPKIHVMEDFAERVITALKRQIEELEDHPS